MATAAFLAVIVAADPRIAQLALCRAACLPAAQAERGCCSTAPASRGPSVQGRSACGCDCCHVVAGRRTGRESRSTFVPPAPLKIDLAAAILASSTPAVAFAPISAAPSPAVVAAGAGSLPCLLCNHLRT